MKTTIRYGLEVALLILIAVYLRLDAHSAPTAATPLVAVSPAEPVPTAGSELIRDQSSPSDAAVQVAQFQSSTASRAATSAKQNDGKLRIICFGAHPDDCEYRVGGTAAMWAKMGHHVKLVSVTNGDIGHWKMAGGPLAQRRTAEAARSDRILGVESKVLDIHDGELMPTLENRRIITRLIRNWQADIVICHRPWDYHPDHRYTGVLVQDAAFMVTVPFFCPDTPRLKRIRSFCITVTVFRSHILLKPIWLSRLTMCFSRKSMPSMRWSLRPMRGEPVEAGNTWPVSRRAARHDAPGSRNATRVGMPRSPTVSAKHSSACTEKRRAGRSSMPKPSRSANTAGNRHGRNSSSSSRFSTDGSVTRLAIEPAK